MLPCSGMSRVVLGQPRGLGTSRYARVGQACHAYFPHYKLQITRTSSYVLRPGPGKRRHLKLSEQDAAAADKAAAWVISGQWKQDLAAAVPEVQQKAQAGVQHMCLLLAGAYQQAQAMWQYVLANWPAWKASLQDDTEVVLEYALGLIPAWLAVLHASILRACQDMAASVPVQQVFAVTAAAVAAAESSAVAATEAVQRSVQQIVQLVKMPLASGDTQLQDTAKRTDEDDHHQVRRGNNLEAARVAYSIAFFGFGQSTSPAHLFAQHAQQLAQHMSLHEWQQQLQQQQEAAYQPRRWRKTQRREWVERVVNRALRANVASNSSSSHMSSRDHMFRPRHEEPIWTAPARHVAGALQAVQQGVRSSVRGATQGCAEAVRSVQATGTAAVGGVQRGATMLVTPVQQAVQRMEPPPASVIAAGIVLLAGAVTSTVMRRQHAAAELERQQRQIMQERAEQLRAQKARIMGVLSVDVPNGNSTGRRKGIAPPALTNIPVTVAGADSVDSETDDSLSADVPVSGSGLREVEMDPEAAAMWKKFLAGSRTTGVPMWNNRMVEDLPKVSRKEMDKQTQKIRSAAAPEDREAIVEADMEQLSRQLQQLDHAPIGRAARAAWLKEQQQKRQQQAQAQPQVAAGSRSTSSSAASERAKGVAATDKSNPFAIPQEVRANWDADLEGDELMPPAPRKQTSRAQPANNGSRSGSRNGNRSSPGAGSDNPFAIPQEALAQWKAEDHIYTEPAKPLLGGVLGGLVTKFTSGKAQPSTAQEHQERRRHALRAEAKEAAAILRLQQQEEEQRQQQQAQAGRAGLLPRQQQQMQKPIPAAQPQAPSAAPAAAAAAAPAGVEGLQEGSPEWNEKTRQEMLRNGAARRARMQQMRSQGGPGAQPGMQVRQRDAAAASSSTLSAVSAADANSVTAAIPAPQQKAPACSAGGANVAEGAGSGAAHKQEVDQSNPFAV